MRGYLFHGYVFPDVLIPGHMMVFMQQLTSLKHHLKGRYGQGVYWEI